MKGAAWIASVTVALVLVLAGAALAGRPAGPPPRVSGASASPPAAWVESGTRSAWAAFGSYCWKTVCVDMIPPQGRPDVPALRAAAGAMVRMHLGFLPRSASLTVGDGKPVRLRAERTLAWRAQHGLMVVQVKGPGGSASYLIRLR